MKTEAKMFSELAGRYSEESVGSSDSYPDPLFRHEPNNQPSNNKKVDQGTNHHSRMIDDVGLTAGSRPQLKRFQPLIINGTSLSECTIGGFEIDLGSVATAAREVVPLPASQLPVIFSDQELNFYHHFFNALSREIGREALDLLASKPEEITEEEVSLSDTIEDLSSAGYEDGDDELKILLKRVFLGTFESEIIGRKKVRCQALRVRANLWGFQYIELGMKCTEDDLRMWVKMNYAYYRTLWYNTFKLSELPSFAVRSPKRLAQLNRPQAGSQQFDHGLMELEQTEKAMNRLLTYHGDKHKQLSPSILSSTTVGRSHDRNAWRRKRRDM